MDDVMAVGIRQLFKSSFILFAGFKLFEFAYNGTKMYCKNNIQ